MALAQEWLSKYATPIVASRLTYPGGVLVDIPAFALNFSSRVHVSLDSSHRETLIKEIESGNVVRSAWETYKMFDQTEAGHLPPDEAKSFIETILKNNGLGPIPDIH